jgi:hypothetical protein
LKKLRPEERKRLSSKRKRNSTPRFKKSFKSSATRKILQKKTSQILPGSSPSSTMSFMARPRQKLARFSFKSKKINSSSHNSSKNDWIIYQCT